MSTAPIPDWRDELIARLADKIDDLLMEYDVDSWAGSGRIALVTEIEDDLTELQTMIERAKLVK